MRNYLTIDVGTTSLKGAVIREDGKLVASASEGYATHRPRPNYVVHQPEAWWQALVAVAADLKEHADLGGIRAIGLSGMAATHVLLDSEGSVLAPAIIWQDTRAGAEARELAAALQDVDKIALFGADLRVTASTQAARMLWLRRHQPAELEACSAILGSKDYLAFRLTGELATDVTSASGFANLRTGKIDHRIARLTGVDAGKLPTRLAPNELVGSVTKRAAADTGLAPGIPVAIGMIDSWCNMLGSGMTRPGQAFDVAGTAEVVGLADAPRKFVERSAAEVYRMHFLTNVDVVYGVTQCGTDALTWLAEVVEPERLSRDDAATVYRDLLQQAETAPPCASGLVFLPFLEGERSPFNDPLMRAGFFGLQRTHAKQELARAVLEGVAFSVRHVLSSCEAACGRRASEVRVSSGGARGALWNRIKADVLGCPVARLQVNDAGSIGAAILAAAGVRDLSLEEGAEAMVRIAEVIEPDDATHDDYKELFEAYLVAIETSSEIMHRLAGFQRKRTTP